MNIDQHPKYRRELEIIIPTLRSIEIYETVDDIISSCRKQELVRARMFASYILRRKLFSLSYIGFCLNKDHATVLHQLRKLNKWRKEDKKIKAIVLLLDTMYIPEKESILQKIAYHKSELERLEAELSAMI